MKFNTVGSALTTLNRRIEVKTNELKEQMIVANQNGSFTAADLDAANAAFKVFMDAIIGHDLDAEPITEIQAAMIRASDLAEELSDLHTTKHADLVIFRKYVPAGSVSPAGFHPSEGVYLRK